MEGSQPTWDKNNLAARDHSVGASLAHYNSLRTHVQLTNRLQKGICPSQPLNLQRRRIRIFVPDLLKALAWTYHIVDEASQFARAGAVGQGERWFYGILTLPALLQTPSDHSPAPPYLGWHLEAPW